MDQEAVDLLTRCADGDDAAWKEFLARYQAFLDFMIRRAIGGMRRGNTAPFGQVEEVRNELLAWLLEKEGRILRTYRGESRITSWLGVVVGRRARRIARRGLGLSSRMVLPLDALSEDAATHLALEEGGADEEDQLREKALARLASALEELPERDRVLLRGAFYDERSYTEIADEIGVKPDSIGQLLFRAKDKLKRKLGDLGLFERLS